MCYTLYNSLRFFENTHLIIIVFEMIFHWSRVSKKNKKKNTFHFMYTCAIFIVYLCNYYILLYYFVLVYVTYLYICPLMVSYIIYVIYHRYINSYTCIYILCRLCPVVVLLKSYFCAFDLRVSTTCIKSVLYIYIIL